MAAQRLGTSASATARPSIVSCIKSNIHSYQVFSNRKLSSCAWRAGRLRPGSLPHSVNSEAHQR